MKTYKERLPEIDKAIFELGVEWPSKNPHSAQIVLGSDGKYDATPDGDYHLLTSDVVICTRTEFEARVADWRRLWEHYKKKWSMASSKFSYFLKDKTARREAVEMAKPMNWQISLDQWLQEDTKTPEVKFDISLPSGEYNKYHRELLPTSTRHNHLSKWTCTTFCGLLMSQTQRYST